MKSSETDAKASGALSSRPPEYSLSPELAAELRRPVRAELSQAEVQRVIGTLGELWPWVSGAVG